MMAAFLLGVAGDRLNRYKPLFVSRISWYVELPGHPKKAGTIFVLYMKTSLVRYYFSSVMLI